MKLKLAAQQLGIRKLDVNNREVRIEFEEQPNVDPMVIINLIQSNPAQFRLEGSSVFKYIGAMATPEQRFNSTEALLDQLLGH